MLVIVVLCIGVLAALEYFRRALDVSDAALMSRLPGTGGYRLMVDVQALRTSGILDQLAGSRAEEEADYRQFVSATGFDYREDLDAIAASFVDERRYFLLRGSFNWPMLHDYAISNGGKCLNAFCAVPLTAPEMYASFYPLTDKVLALAVTRSAQGAYAINNTRLSMTGPPVPALPLWMEASGTTLGQADSLPAGAKSFVSAVQDAEQVTLGLGAKGGEFEAVLEARCPDKATADGAAAKLNQVTALLRSFLNRAGQQPNPTDLSGVLTAGAFEVRDRTVVGRWPIHRAFLESIAGGS